MGNKKYFIKSIPEKIDHLDKHTYKISHKCCDILKKEPERVQKLISNANYMRKNLKEKGFNVIEGRTAIVPVIVGNDEIAFKMWRLLYDSGVFVNVFISPGVPEGRQMMRTSYMATHEKEHLDEIVHHFEKAGKTLGLI